MRSFQDGLGAAHLGPPAHTTVIRHSYGTLVVSGAAATSLGANDVVLVASPGIDVARAEDLRLAGVDPAGNRHHHVFATASPTDPTQRVLGPRIALRNLGRIIAGITPSSAPQG